MLTIILGIALSFGILFILAIYTNVKAEFASIIGGIMIVSSITVGLMIPISGYSDWELVEEKELISLSNSLGTEGYGGIYVSLSAENVYTYRYEIESEFGTETSREYVTKTISFNVQEIEDPNCQKPVIRTYLKKAKKTAWTFALGANEYSYVFYVPEGTISKEVNLQ